MNPENKTTTLNPQPIIETQSISETQVPQPIKNNWTTSILFLILGIVLGASGLWGYQWYHSQSTNQQINYSTASPSPTTDPTKNWKTYINEKYGYEIKYPQNLRRINCEGENEMFYIAMAGDTPISDLIEPQNCARDSRYNLEIVVSDKQFSEDGRYNTTKTKYVVASTDATKVEFTQKSGFEGPGEPWYIEINFKKGNYYFQAYTRNKDLEGTLDQILSTFKFLDQKQSVNTSDWKTYINNEFKFSIKYPPSWKDITDANTIKNGNKEFTLQTNGGEYVSGIVLNTVNNNGTPESWSKQFLLNDDKFLLITYTDNLGPGSKGGTKDVDTFNQILSTFKFNK